MIKYHSFASPRLYTTYLYQPSRFVAIILRTEHLSESLDFLIHALTRETLGTIERLDIRQKDNQIVETLPGVEIDHERGEDTKNGIANEADHTNDLNRKTETTDIDIGGCNMEDIKTLVASNGLTHYELSSLMAPPSIRWVRQQAMTLARQQRASVWTISTVFLRP